MPLDESTVELTHLLRIRQVWMRRWWRLTFALWLSVGSMSLWSLRRTWAQVIEQFTWAALRYGLAFNRPAAIGLGLCLGLTIALLLKESRFLLWGLSRKERYQLLKAWRKQRKPRRP